MKFIVKGGRPLSGEIKLAGSKNAAPKMMIVSLLTDEECTLTNFPDIGDTAITTELLRNIGSEVKIFAEGGSAFDGKNGAVKIRTVKIKNSRVLQLSRRNRIPILALGPLFARAELLRLCCLFCRTPGIARHATPGFSFYANFL